MSSFSRHHHHPHRASWHSAGSYTPSLGLSAATTATGSSSSSRSSISGTSSGYGRYASSDYATKYSTGGYRRHSSTDYGKYGSGSSSGTTTGGDYVSRYGSTGTSSSRLGSSSISSSNINSRDTSTRDIGSSAAGYRAAHSSIPAYTKRFETSEEYDRHRSSDFTRRTSVDAAASSGSPRTSLVSDHHHHDDSSHHHHHQPPGEDDRVRTFRTRRRSSAASQDDADGKSRTAEERRTLSTRRDRGYDEAKRHDDDDDDGVRHCCSLENESSPSALPPIPKRRSRVGSRTSARGDGDQVFEEDDGGDQTRASRTPTTPKGSSPGLKSGHPPDVVSTSARGSRAQEVARLESLCEARTKELSLARMRLRESVQAFDAMACLLNYCTNQLDGLSCPLISAKLKKATDKLTEQQQSLERANQEKSQVEQQLQELQAARDAAQLEVGQLKEQLRQEEETHRAAQLKLQEEQSAALKALREEVSSQHQETLQKMQKYQENETESTRQTHNRQLVELTSEHQMATNTLKVQHLEDVQEIRNKHELQVEELHVQHRKKLEDITDRFESIKLSLTEKVQSLCTECDDLRLRAKSSEDALQKDADVKVQLALTPYLHLPKEIESLKTVIDMRTEEIQKLRRQNMDLVKQLEELPIVQEKVVSLQQKVENLQAIINIKTDHEKQLHEKCQVLMRKYDRESRTNKRLSMDYEQVVWRMSQSADFSSTASSMESISPRAGGGQLSRSSSRGGSAQPCYSHGSSPVRSLSSSSQGAVAVDGSNGVTARRQRKASGGGGDEQDQRRRANTFSSDTPRHRRARGDVGDGDEGLNINGPGVGSGTSRRRGLSKSGDYSGMVSSTATTTTMNTATKDHDHEESFSSSGHESGDTSDFFSSLESNVILETPQGVSFNLVDRTSAGGELSAVAAHDDVLMEEMVMLHPIEDASPEETTTTTTTTSCSLPPPPHSAENKQPTEVVTVVVTSQSSL